MCNEIHMISIRRWYVNQFDRYAPTMYVNMCMQFVSIYWCHGQRLDMTSFLHRLSSHSFMLSWQVEIYQNPFANPYHTNLTWMDGLWLSIYVNVSIHDVDMSMNVDLPIQTQQWASRSKVICHKIVYLNYPWSLNAWWESLTQHLQVRHELV